MPMASVRLACTQLHTFYPIQADVVLSSSCTCPIQPRMLNVSLTIKCILFQLLLIANRGAFGLKVIALNVPEHTETGKSVLLQCLYELEGDDLYSVKWYKDNNEFYRYLPKDKPPGQIFTLPGVSVDPDNSTNNSVFLDNIEWESSGKYRCEVSAEAPSFNTMEMEKEMNVYDVPDDGPQMIGKCCKFNVGDTVRVNCTAVRSKPAASLEWHLNEDKASRDILHEYPIVIDDDGLETSILGLQFVVEPSHFANGDLNLRCTASISYVYQQSFKQTITRDLAHASFLEDETTHVKINCSNMTNLPYTYYYLLSLLIYFHFIC